jgi:carbon storage regulator
MLVLTRKSNQSIMIGDNIEVSVLAIMGEKVRIGIQADRTVPVFRKEVYLEIQAEQSEEPTAAEETEAEETESEETESEETESEDAGAANGRSEVDAALRSLGEPE